MEEPTTSIEYIFDLVHHPMLALPNQAFDGGFSLLALQNPLVTPGIGNPGDQEIKQQIAARFVAEEPFHRGFRRAVVQVAA